MGRLPRTRGDRPTDWYWWLGAYFGENPGGENPGSENPGSENPGTPPAAVAPHVREPKPAPTKKVVAPRTRTQRDYNVPDRSRLYRAACEGQDGYVTVKMQRDEKNYFRAPRVDPAVPLSVRPLCALAVIDEYRDSRTSGVAWAFYTVSERVRPRGQSVQRR